MIVLIHGKNTYLSREKLKELAKDEAVVLDLIENPELSVQDIENELKHDSLFSDQKTIVIRDALLKIDIKKLKTDNLIIFYETREVPVKERKGIKEVYKFDLLKGKELKDWVKKQFKGFKIEAIDELIKSTDNDLWRLSFEVNKLKAFKIKEKEIKAEDIALLIRPGIEAQIFKTIDAIASKDKKTALDLIYKHLEAGDAPLYLLTMINYQFRNLLIVKDLHDTSVLKMHPFVIKKSQYLAHKFTKEKLESIYLKIFKMDLAIKRGKIKPEMALELLIADI